jgi:cytochrome P450 family 2 subfamily U polypeptide 1
MSINITLDSSRRLHYVEATIREIQRVGDIAPLGVPHAAAEDTYFTGYLIPKGSWIVSNLNSCHRDPKYWPDPERFDPTRFLDENGQLLRNTPSLMPFCAGKTTR